ncbi:MAG: hypothetical protein ACTJLK_03355 [Anaplasma sp.]
MPDKKSPIHGQVEDWFDGVITRVARTIDPYLARATIIGTVEHAAHTGVEFSRSINRRLLHKVNGVLVPEISHEDILNIKHKIEALRGQEAKVVDVAEVFPLLDSQWYNNNLPEMAVACHVMHQLFCAEEYLGCGLDDGKEVMRRITSSIQPIIVPKIDTALMLETIYFSNMECLIGGVGYAFMEIAKALGCVFVHSKISGRTEIEKFGFSGICVKHASEFSLVPIMQPGMGIAPGTLDDDTEEAILRRLSIGKASILLEVNMSASDSGIRYEPIVKITIPEAALYHARAGARSAEKEASSNGGEGDLTAVVKYHSFEVPFRRMAEEISQVVQDRRGAKKKRMKLAEEKANSASPSATTSSLSLSDPVSKGRSNGQAQQPARGWPKFAELKAWTGSFFFTPSETESRPQKKSSARGRIICKVFRVNSAGDILECSEVRAGDEYKSQRAVSGDCIINGIVAQEFEAKVDRRAEEELVRTWSGKKVGGIMGMSAGELPENDSGTSIVRQSANGGDGGENAAQQQQLATVEENPSSKTTLPTTPPGQQEASAVADRSAGSQSRQDSAASDAPKHQGRATAKIIAPSTSKESTEKKGALGTTEPRFDPNPGHAEKASPSVTFQVHQDQGPERDYLDQVYLRNPSSVVADQREYVNFKVPDGAAMKRARRVAAEVLLSHFAELDVHSAIRRGVSTLGARSGLATFDDCIKRGSTAINGIEMTNNDISPKKKCENISEERLAIHGLGSVEEYREKFGAGGYRTQVSDTLNYLFNDSLRYLPYNKVPHQALIEEMINSLNRYSAMNISVDMRKIIERCGLAAHYVPFDPHEPIRRRTFITCTDSNRVNILLTDVVRWVGGYARTRLNYELHLSPDNNTISYKNVRLGAVLPGDKEPLPSLGLMISSSKKISTWESTASTTKNVSDDGIVIIRALNDMHMDVRRMSETRDVIEPFLVRDLRQYLAGEMRITSVTESERESELCKKLHSCGAHVRPTGAAIGENTERVSTAGDQSSRSNSSGDREEPQWYIRGWNLLCAIGRAIAGAARRIANGAIALLRRPFFGRSSEHYSSVGVDSADASTPVQQDIVARTGVTLPQQPEHAASQEDTEAEQCAPQERSEDPHHLTGITTRSAVKGAAPSQRQTEDASAAASAHNKQAPLAVISDDSSMIEDPVQPGSGIGIHLARGPTAARDESQQAQAGSRML